MNVLLVTIDTLRADHLECYGYPKKTSPTLAKLARESVVFDWCFAPTMPTTPSFTSIFTSVDAYGHEIVNVAGDVALNRKFKTLAQLLRRQGFFTAAVDSKQKPWFAWGYDRHVVHPSGLDREKRVKRSMEAVNECAWPLLEELPKRRPWFLWLHPWDPHTPYWPPKRFERLFYEGDEKDPNNLSLTPCHAFEGFANAYRGWFPPEVTDIKYIVNLYDGMIRYNSVHLAKTFRRMQDLGLWDDTLVIVMSDHGEILDKHTGQFDHHGLYEGNIRIPLIIKFPGGEFGGSRVSALTSNVDVAPTIFDVLGLRQPRQFEGRSLRPLVRGERTEQYRELFLGEGTYQCKRGVRTKEWKLIRALSTRAKDNWHGEGKVELYNLAKDPWEQTNVVHMWPSVTRDLEERLDGWLEQQREKWGHDDPIKVQGHSIGKRMLAAQRNRDRQREWEIV